MGRAVRASGMGITFAEYQAQGSPSGYVYVPGDATHPAQMVTEAQSPWTSPTGGLLTVSELQQNLYGPPGAVAPAAPATTPPPPPPDLLYAPRPIPPIYRDESTDPYPERYQRYMRDAGGGGAAAMPSGGLPTAPAMHYPRAISDDSGRTLLAVSANGPLLPMDLSSVVRNADGSQSFKTTDGQSWIVSPSGVITSASLFSSIPIWAWIAIGLTGMLLFRRS